jgi:uncharacterized iron-regulated protein
MARLLLTLSCALALSVSIAADSVYVPERVLATAKKPFSDFETMLADIARADVVFVGEQHDDANTHRIELALLEGLARRRGEIVLALEMFERDVQEPLGHFLMGHMDEADFLQEARPWPRYATDYKPLVDVAISKQWDVIAANVPRSIAAEVSASGLDVLKTKSDSDKALFARDIRCPLGDSYFRRLARVMGSSGHQAAAPDAAAAGAPGPVSSAASLQNFYFAQCLKDETMAESIAQAYSAGAVGGKRPLVISINGAFHSDYREGVVERTMRRLPDKHVLVVTIQPTLQLDDLAPDADTRKRADYVVYTIGGTPPADSARGRNGGADLQGRS